MWCIRRRHLCTHDPASWLGFFNHNFFPTLPRGNHYSEFFFFPYHLLLKEELVLGVPRCTSHFVFRASCHPPPSPTLLPCRGPPPPVPRRPRRLPGPWDLGLPHGTTCPALSLTLSHTSTTNLSHLQFPALLSSTSSFPPCMPLPYHFSFTLQTPPI